MLMTKVIISINFATDRSNMSGIYSEVKASTDNILKGGRERLNSMESIESDDEKTSGKKGNSKRKVKSKTSEDR